MSRIEINKVVEILTTDSRMITEWARFADSLEIPVHESVPWMSQISTGVITTYILFKNLITAWVNRQRNMATVSMLRSKLVANEFNFLSDQLHELTKAMPTPVIVVSQVGDNSTEYLVQPTTQTDLINGLGDFRSDLNKLTFNGRSLGNLLFGKTTYGQKEVLQQEFNGDVAIITTQETIRASGFRKWEVEVSYRGKTLKTVTQGPVGEAIHQLLKDVGAIV